MAIDQPNGLIQLRSGRSARLDPLPIAASAAGAFAGGMGGSALYNWLSSSPDPAYTYADGSAWFVTPEHACWFYDASASGDWVAWGASGDFFVLGDTGFLYGVGADGSWFAVDADGDFAAVDEFGNAAWGDADTGLIAYDPAGDGGATWVDSSGEAAGGLDVTSDGGGWLDWLG